MNTEIKNHGSYNTAKVALNEYLSGKARPNNVYATEFAETPSVNNVGNYEAFIYALNEHIAKDKRQKSALISKLDEVDNLCIEDFIFVDMDTIRKESKLERKLMNAQQNLQSWR